MINASDARLLFDDQAETPVHPRLKETLDRVEAAIVEAAPKSRATSSRVANHTDEIIAILRAEDYEITDSRRPQLEISWSAVP